MNLPSLLRLELVQLPLLPVDFSLLRLKTSLYVGVLLLSRLHLIADQGSADQANGSSDAGPRAGIASRASDNRAQAGAAKGPINRALLARGQRLRASGKRNRHDDCRKNVNRSHRALLQRSLGVRSRIVTMMPLLAAFCLHALRIQPFNDGDHRLDETPLGICPAAFFQQ